MSAPLKLGFKYTGRGEPFAPRPQDTVSNSARIAEAERTISRLEEENSVLRQELNDVRALYKQLTTESSSECFDERRVNLLKSQVIQLERQNAMLTDTISSRSETLMEAENDLAATVDYCQSVLASNESFREVRVSCCKLEQIITTLETARQRLSRMADKTYSVRKCSKPLLWYGSFLQNRPDHPVTLFDVCRGEIEHINLKHVSRLESKLVSLYKELTLVSSTLQLCLRSSSDAEGATAAPNAVYSRLSNQVQRSCDMLQDVCSQLLQLSLLVPAAPLPALKKPPIVPVTVESVVKVFGKSAKTRDAKQLIESLIKYVNFSVNVAGIENHMLLEELEFHRRIYRLQTQYVESLFPSIRKCYSEFETDLQTLICQPLGEVMQVFYNLKHNTDNRSLLNFIEVFRNHASVLSEVLERLSVNPSSEKDHQLSEHGIHFLGKMNQCHSEQKRSRDLRIAELDVVKQHLTAETKELVQVLGEKDQSISVNGISRPTSMQTYRKSVSDGSLQAKCDCHVEDANVTADKLYPMTRFYDETPETSMNEPCTLPCASSMSPSVLPVTSVSTARCRPPVSNQSRSKTVVPGIAKRSLVLKPKSGKSSCDDTGERSADETKTTHSKTRDLSVMKSCSFAQNVTCRSNSLQEQPDMWLKNQPDFSNDSRRKASGRRSAASVLTDRQSDGFQGFYK